MTKSIWIIDHKKKFELNYIFNSVTFHYFKFSIVKFELSNIQLQQKNCGHLLVIKTFYFNWEICSIIWIGELQKWWTETLVQFR
jgi:hypothetical protein